MPTAMTFTSLQEDVRGYLERGSAADTIVYAQIPRLINLAERRISRDLKILGFQTVVTTTFNAGQAVYVKPERWRETISVEVGTGTSGETRSPVNARGLEFVKAFWPDRTVQGQPRYYADYDFNNWIVAPTPDAAYEAEILFYQLPALLDELTDTNWVTEYMPAAILYGTLLEAAPFVMNDERMAVWQGLYTDAISKTDAEDIRRMADRAATRQEA